MDQTIAFIKAHPIVVTAVVVFIFVWFLLSGSGSGSSSDNTASANAAAAQAIAASQAAATALQTNVNDNATQLGIATIQGKVAEAAVAANLQATAYNADLEKQSNVMSVLQTIADTTLGQVSQAVAFNYQSQLAAASGGKAPSLAENIYAPNGTTVNGVFYPHGATFTTTRTVPGVDPAGVQEINTANTNLEEMYNNLLKAVTGGGNYSQNAIITTGSGATTSTTTHRVDPIFVNTADPNKLPTVTDVTPSATSAYGWIGSFVDPNTGVNIKIG